MFSCSKIEQKQLNTWVSFQSAEQPLLGQFSVSGTRALLRHEMVLMPLWSQINAWEAFCEVLSSGESFAFALLDAAKQSFFSALEAIEQREHTRLMASYAALRKRYPELEIGLGQT